MHPRDPLPPAPHMNLLSCLLRSGRNNKIHVCFLRCDGACVSPGPWRTTELSSAPRQFGGFRRHLPPERQAKEGGAAGSTVLSCGAEGWGERLLVVMAT